MSFCIWKSPLIILLFLGYKVISVTGGKVLTGITDHIYILCYIQNIAVCALLVFGCCVAVKYACMSFMNMCMYDVCKYTN